MRIVHDRPSHVRRPGTEFRDVTLWMLNDRLEDDELVRQLEGIRAAGCGAVIARTFNGLRSDYPGEGFMASMETLIAAARRLGLRVYLQAGFMPACVPDLPEEFCLPVLAAKPEGAAADTRPLAVCGDFSIYAERSAGRLDLLNPAAADYYLDLAYERTWRRFKSEFGKTIVSMWVDEPHFNPPTHSVGRQSCRPRSSASGAIRWPARFPACSDGPEIGSRSGINIGAPFLRCCRRAISPRSPHGAARTGWPSAATSWARTTWSRRSDGPPRTMPLYPFMDIPGIDHLTRSLEWGCYADAGERGIPFLLTPAQCVSVAAQADKPAALCEMYGVSSQSLTFRDQKFIGDYFFSKGINLRCLHGTFYSLRGRRKRIYPPHLSYQQPWWPEQRMVGDYFARLGYALRQGRRSADVLVLHPLESAFILYDPVEVYPDAPRRPRGRCASATVEMEKLNASLVGVLPLIAGIAPEFRPGRRADAGPHGKRGRGRHASCGRDVLPGRRSAHAAHAAPFDFAVAGAVQARGRNRARGGRRTPERVEGVPDAAARDFAEAVRAEGRRPRLDRGAGYGAPSPTPYRIAG